MLAAKPLSTGQVYMQYLVLSLKLHKSPHHHKHRICPFYSKRWVLLDDVKETNKTHQHVEENNVKVRALKRELIFLNLFK